MTCDYPNLMFLLIPIAMYLLLSLATTNCQPYWSIPYINVGPFLMQSCMEYRALDICFTFMILSWCFFVLFWTWQPLVTAAFNLNILQNIFCIHTLLTWSVGIFFPSWYSDLFICFWLYLFFIIFCQTVHHVLILSLHIFASASSSDNYICVCPCVWSVSFLFSWL